jgi:hypothetical protein
MKSVTPEQLSAHRAFFTDFDKHGDPGRISVTPHNTALATILERKLKLYLLTKAHVVIAGSQLLESPFAHDLLLNNPDLLKSGAIIPSIKIDHPSATDFLAVKRGEVIDRPKSPYHSTRALEVAILIDTAATSVRWPLSAMSDWFRSRLADDLANDQSLLRVALRREGIMPPPGIISEIRSQEGLSRGTVDRIVVEANIPRFRDVMKTYTDFVYYLSGARATNSEGVLPQENLVDFSLSELVGGKTNLSDYQVFFKIFIDIAKARTRTCFPDEFLDAISVADALELRSIALSKRFTATYNSIQERSKAALRLSDPDRFVLLLEELDEFETNLHVEFEAALCRELPARVLEKRQRSAGRVLQAVVSWVIPGADIMEIVVSTLDWMGFDQASNSVSLKIEQGCQALEESLQRMGLLRHQELLGFVDSMKRKYVDRLRPNA